MRKQTTSILLIVVTILLASEFVYLTHRIRQTNEEIRDLNANLLAADFEFVTDYFGFKYRGFSRDYIDRMILLYGAYEKYVLFFMRDVIANLDDKDCVVFDVGAFTGTHSLYLSQYAKTIHAFEPFPPNIKRLNEMLVLNQIENVIVHPIGLGKENGTLPFYVPPAENTANGSFMGEWLAQPNGETLMLDIVRGDDLDENIISRVDLIKIDIEGYEKPAISGLRNTLMMNRPIVIMELNIGLEHEWTSVEDMLDHFPSDYRLMEIKSGNWSTSDYKLNVLNFDRLMKLNKKHPGSLAPFLHPNIVLYPSERESVIPVHNRNP